LLQVLEKAVIELPLQVGLVVEPAPDQLCRGACDEPFHLRMARSDDVLDEDETLASACGGAIELALGRRDALRILESVLRAEEADVDRRMLDLGEEHRARFTIRRRKIFEEKHLEALTEELVAAHKVAESLPLGRELLLRAADEDPLLHAAPDPMISASSPSVSFSRARMSARISSSARSGCG